MLLALAAYIVAAGLFVLPAAVTVVTLRHGPRIGLLLIIVLGALSLFAGGVGAGLMITLGFGGAGLALWHFGRRPIRLELYFAGVLSILFVGTLGVHYALSAAIGIGPVDASYAILDGIRASYQSYIDLIAANASAEQLAQVQEIKAAQGFWVWGFFRLMPSLMILTSGAMVLVNLLIVRHVLPALLGLELNRWRVPDQLIWVVLVPGIGLLPSVTANITGRESGELMQMLFYSALNLVLIGLLPYFVQGLAVMSFFFKRWRLPRLLRGLGYFLAFFQGLAPMIAALGLMEFWTDFRGRALAPKEPKEEDEEL